MITTIIFVLGLLIGSFLNVCTYRIPREESIAYPPSHCTSCNNRIESYDLIPVISYILLKGKCRHCGEKISIKYPLIELSTGIIFTAIYFKYGFSLKLLKFLVLTSFLIVIGIIDYNTTDVYLETTLSGVIAGLIFLGINYYLKLPVKTYIIGALIGGGVVSIIILITGAIGWGDAEICVLGGLYLGMRLTILMLFLSVVIGGSVGTVLIFLKKKSKKDYMPLGPSISVSTIICVLLGEKILTWYLGTFK